MQDKPRYLTKTRFILGLECPAKLYYYGKKDYPNRKADNEFMLSLADGGYQVGELARYYHPGGVAVDTLDFEEAITLTDSHLAQDEAVIYEAAFRFDTLFVRADVLVKKGNRIDLIEVKAKSFRSEDEFFLRNGGLSGNWEHYLQDVAFQKYVINKAKPEFKVHAYLMVADKTAEASVDGLNQRFIITRDDRNRRDIRVVGDTSPAALGDPVLTKVDVDDIVDRIISGGLFKTDFAGQLLPVNAAGSNMSTFEYAVRTLADAYSRDVKIDSPVGARCKDCEYMTLPEEDLRGSHNGFRECWKKAAAFSDADFTRPLVLDIWNWRAKGTYLDKGIYFQDELTKDDFFDARHPEPDSNSSRCHGLSPRARQYLQVSKSVSCDTSPYIDRAYVAKEFAAFTFPLHMIDFETATCAIPFHKGRHPYEQIAFQFSHHTIDADGTIAHAGEFIATERGKFPNFDFVRALKHELEHDDGTVFRYASHENSVLNQIRAQLLASHEPDRDSLVAFIETITHNDGKYGTPRKGNRDMYDMLELIKKGFYHVSMKGSNSIKYVLPAVLNASNYLKDKYSRPIYGTDIPSRNFKDFAVVEIDAATGLVKNPYLRLRPVLDGLDAAALDNELLYDDSETIKEGGSAAVAFGRMQYSIMTDEEHVGVIRSLLSYCELDTLAMVLVWEYFDDEIKRDIG